MINNPSGRFLLNEGDGFLTDIINYMATSDFDILKSIAARITNTNPDPNKIVVNQNIAKAAAGLTAVFPVIVTEAVPLEQAVMVSKAIERKCVAMLQMLFAANQITTATGAYEYMKRFHTNIDPSIDLSDMDVDGVIDYTNKGYEYARGKKGSFWESTESSGMTKLEKLADMDIDDIIMMSEESLLESKGFNTGALIHNAQVNKIIGQVIQSVKESANDTFIPENINEGSLNEFRSFSLNEADFYRQTTSKETKVTVKSPPTDPGQDDVENVFITRNSDVSSDAKNAYEVFNKQVLQSDIKKANEATPSLMIINFTTARDNGDSILNTCVIGVKARIHYVPSSEMITRIIMKNTDRRGFFNFLRATTGEIAFFKDFLLAVDKAKIDAVAKAGKGSSSKIWKLLELRADRSKFNRSIGKNSSAAAAISTIVISRAEADLIKKNNRIDITKPGTLLSIMRGYNLMCGAIVDEVAERVDFMYDDGTTSFETLSFMALEREDSGGSYKKVINLLAKGR